MKRAIGRPGIRTIESWTQGRTLFERWRKNLSSVEVELKQPRLINMAPVEFVGGEVVEPAAQPTRKFRGQMIYWTNADVTIRRRSGAILVIDNYEIVAVSDGKTRFEPAGNPGVKSEIARG